MTRIRFVHTADVHFGVENYGRIDPATGIHTRLLDFERAFSACVDRAIAESVDFFLFCGDAYKTATPTPTQQRLLLRALLRLHHAHIPVIIIVGNHDHPASFGKAHALDIYSELPLDGFTVVAKPQLIRLATQNGPVQIIGIPWPMRSTLALADTTLSGDIPQKISAALAEIIVHLSSQLDHTIPTVLAAHLTVSTGIFSGSEKRAIYGTDPVLHVHELARPEFDYVALGHLHRHQNLNPQGTPPVVYSGSIERVDFGERNEEKGFCLVTITRTNTAEIGTERTTEYEFIEVPTRRFIQIDVTLADTVGVSQTAQIVAAISNHDIRDAVIKIIYTLPAHAPDRVELDVVQQHCSTAHAIAGIVAKRIQSVAHERRRIEQSTHERTLTSLVQAYCQQKPELVEHTQAISALIEQIAAQAENPEQPRDPQDM